MTIVWMLVVAVAAAGLLVLLALAEDVLAERKHGRPESYWMSRLTLSAAFFSALALFTIAYLPVAVL